MDTPQTKPGPPNPAAEGPDAPTPPGGPQRQDAADTDEVPGHPDARDVPPADEDTQEENAETSLDQPSDGSGGE